MSKKYIKYDLFSSHSYVWFSDLIVCSFYCRLLINSIMKGGSAYKGLFRANKITQAVRLI